MTEEQIRAASGRELDALVAEHILGWATGTWQGELATIERCFSRVIPAMREKGFVFSIEDAYAWPSEGWEPGTTGIKFEKRLATDLVVWGSELTSFGEEATGICRAALLCLLAEEGK